jgi:hypothetical protein
LRPQDESFIGEIMISGLSAQPKQQHKAAIVISLSFFFLLLAFPCFAEERSEGKSDHKPAQLSVPISGTISGTFSGLGKFTGTLSVQRFVEVNGQVKALGMVSGTLFDATGVPLGTALQGPLLFPVTVGPATTRSAAIQPPELINRPILLKASLSVGPSLSPVPQPLQSTCQPLNLSIGAQSLNILGLTVATTPIDITLGGQTGGTNALGTLVCNILTTLTNVAGLTNLLNQLLGLLGGL